MGLPPDLPTEYYMKILRNYFSPVVDVQHWPDARCNYMSTIDQCLKQSLYSGEIPPEHDRIRCLLANFHQFTHTSAGRVALLGMLNEWKKCIDKLGPEDKKTNLDHARFFVTHAFQIGLGAKIHVGEYYYDHTHRLEMMEHFNGMRGSA
jgi:hypothetical protein